MRPSHCIDPRSTASADAWAVVTGSTRLSVILIFIDGLLGLKLLKNQPTALTMRLDVKGHGETVSSIH